VLQITEAEMDLREATREAEQLRWAMTAAELDGRAAPLAEEQRALSARTRAVAEAIAALPDAAGFGAEIAVLGAADAAMGDAEGFLRVPDTGAPAIAAETEAIELLLQARRAGGGGGGGGGTTPGASSASGDAALSALALVGRGTASSAVVEPRTVEQRVGDGSLEYPAEFRAGLDRYFEEIDGN
jgi:hypothetical protein